MTSNTYPYPKVRPSIRENLQLKINGKKQVARRQIVNTSTDLLVYLVMSRIC